MMTVEKNLQVTGEITTTSSNEEKTGNPVSEIAIDILSQVEELELQQSTYRRFSPQNGMYGLLCIVLTMAAGLIVIFAVVNNKTHPGNTQEMN